MATEKNSIDTKESSHIWMNSGLGDYIATQSSPPPKASNPLSKGIYSQLPKAQSYANVYKKTPGSSKKSTLIANLELKLGGFFISEDNPKNPYIFLGYVAGTAIAQGRDVNGNASNVSNNNLISITKEEYLKLAQEAKDEITKRFNFNSEEEERKDFRRLHYNKAADKFSYNYIMAYNGVYSSDVFMKYKTHLTDSMWDLADIQDTLLLLIPHEWLIHCNYNQKFVKQYVEILNSFGLGIITCKLVPCDEFFKKLPKLSEHNGCNHNLFYEFSFKSESPKLKFMLASLIKDMYTQNLNHIPGLFMQLAEKYADKSAWEMLVTAYAIAAYEPSSTFISVTEINHNGRRARGLPIPSIKSNKIEEVTDRLEDSNNDIRSSFIYALIPSSYFIDKILAFTHVRDYERAIKNLHTITN